MALKFSAAVRNARLDAIETTISTAPTLNIYSGTAPSATTDAASGTLLASMTLPSDWMGAANAGAKALAGTWTDSSADNGGVAGYFRVLASTTCHIQGTCGASGSGADMILSSTTITAGLPVGVSSFTLTDGNA